MIRVATLVQLTRFGIVGLTATGVHYVVALGVSVLVSPYLANLAGYASAVGVSYFGHQRVTFRVDPAEVAHRRHLPRFVVTSLSALALSQLVLATGRALALPDAPALALAVLTVPPYTFLLSRVWVFR